MRAVSNLFHHDTGNVDDEPDDSNDNKQVTWDIESSFVLQDQARANPPLPPAHSKVPSLRSLLSLNSGERKSNDGGSDDGVRSQLDDVDEEGETPRVPLNEAGTASLPSGQRDRRSSRPMGNSGTSGNRFSGRRRSTRSERSSTSPSTILSAWSPLSDETSTFIIVILILFLGIASAAIFLGVGISGTQAVQNQTFIRDSRELLKNVQGQIESYKVAASMVHTHCRTFNVSEVPTNGGIAEPPISCTRNEFRKVYNYVTSWGMEFKALQFDPYVPHDQRQVYEDSARAFYAAHYPDFNYRGFAGFEPPLGLAGGLQPRSDQPFYYPIHFMEPIVGNTAAVGLDYYSHESRRQTLETALTTGKPALTDRLTLVKDIGETSRCTEGIPDGQDSYGVVLMHPGVDSSDGGYYDTATVTVDGVTRTVNGDSSLYRAAAEMFPRDLSSIVICMPTVLRKSTEKRAMDVIVYIHDSTDSSGETKFLGGVRVEVFDDGSNAKNGDPLDGELLPHKYHFLPEISLSDLSGHLTYQNEIPLTDDKRWTVTVVAIDGTYESSLVFVIIGGVVVLVASGCLSLWIYNNHRRMKKFSELKSKSESEKAALILENARQATKAERELNDFIGHEVRNPVAAAIAACSFVKSEVSKEEPLRDQESLMATREDVTIIDNSLRFVSDLLRNMLDMHRAADKQLSVSMAPVDVLHDVLEPVAGMLHTRGGQIVEVMVDCPRDLFVMTDSLRLKQVMLNLSRNSSKFVTQGFIRLRAEEKDNNIKLTVDDSGSGIPKEKRDRLFNKFQESLDLLSQGTGIGLFLCKKLTELMGGELYLDDDYDSGIEGFPGTRFVVDLKKPPIDHPAGHGESQSELNLTMEEPSPKHILTKAFGSEGNGTATTEPQGEDGSDNEVLSVTKLPTDVIATPPPSPATSAAGSAIQSPQSQPLVLPEGLSVLFVDDDPILRKLFCRTIRKVAPEWTFREAANGETALRLVETEEFSLIFMDMYMASVEKQLLGTETVVELRARGVQSRICGLSANDLEVEFLKAGADAFLLKPFPCKAEELKIELLRILYGGARPIER